MARGTSIATTANHIISLERVKHDVDRRLAVFFDDQIQRSGSLHANYADLWQIMREVTDAGGKRLRPYLLLAAYEGSDGRDYQSALEVATAYELLHISLLIHDDIIDKDYVRHGSLNVAGRMKRVYELLGVDDESRHLGNSAAILAGDLLISAAYEIVLASSLSAEQKVAVSRGLGNAIFTVGGGELLDMESTVRDFHEVDPVTIAALKTAQYSFVEPLVIGAMLAGAGQELITALRAFGSSAGIAYQLTDDLLGVFGNESQTGKSALGDLREGKRTYLISQSMARASQQDVAVLTAGLGSASLTQAQAHEMRDIIERSGARVETENQIKTLVSHAQATLDDSNMPAELQATLQQIIKRSTKRVA